MDILNEIAARTRKRIQEKKESLSVEEIIRKAEEMMRKAEDVAAVTAGAGIAGAGTDFPFERAMRKDDISFICEVKRASPTKGMIAESFPYVQIAKEYESAGADAVSVLTEPYYFKGDDRYLSEISENVGIPLLRKDFTVDSYMIYEARILGASAVLLIASILTEKELAQYIQIAHRLGLSALVETHTEKEVKTALDAGARIIGVNNRNLKTFAVDLSISERLRKLIPSDILFISESGVKTAADVERLRAIGANGALIGETFMRSADKAKEMSRLRGENRNEPTARREQR